MGVKRFVIRYTAEGSRPPNDFKEWWETGGNGPYPERSSRSLSIAAVAVWKLEFEIDP
jgi:hypothetical protein